MSTTMYNFKKEKDIYIITLKGNFSIDEVITIVEEFRTTKPLPLEINLLYDLRLAHLEVEQAQDFKKIVDYTSFSTQQFKRVKTAIVVKEPKQTAYSFMFADDRPHPYIKRRVFTTLEAAVDWINIYS